MKGPSSRPVTPSQSVVQAVGTRAGVPRNSHHIVQLKSSRCHQIGGHFQQHGGGPQVSRRLFTTSVSGSAAGVGQTQEAASIYRPRRSFLYVPGSSQKMLAKSLTSDADTVCLDVEDGVALSAKSDARSNISSTLQTGTFKTRTEVSIRINAVSSGNLYKDDIAWLHTLSILPHSVTIPKVDSLSEYQTICHDFSNLESARGLLTPIQLITMVESPTGVLELDSILRFNALHGKRITALIFGGDDYASSVGARRTESNHELSFARNMSLMVAAKYDIPAIDIVCKEFKDLSRFDIESRQSVELGFTGRQVIHPNQIAAANEIYSPSQDLLKWANGVIESYEKNDALGIGAFTYDGMMIDLPTIKRAFSIRNRAAACGIELH